LRELSGSWIGTNAGDQALAEWHWQAPAIPRQVLMPRLPAHGETLRTGMKLGGRACFLCASISPRGNCRAAVATRHGTFD
jgi:hypothetical protein